MLRSPRLERLADRLLSLQNDSGLTKPEFAAFLGISGSQFRYLRRRLTNPSIHSLAVDFGFNVRLGEFENSKPYGK